ncbi:MAG: ABC transporter substrate-binding protein [Bifidobacteriaceae bacterium]|nr:ABC transporter substrate-binding protein [Bifidobacteriaceae bacterium]
MRRTRILAALGAAALLVGTAACGTDDESTSGSDNTGDTTSATEVEVFTWWTAGSEALGLEQLQGVLTEKYPDVEFINGGITQGGGSGKDLLQTRLAAGQPPDTFQVHAGKEAQDYIDAGQVEDVTDLYEKFGLNGVFPQDLIDMLTQDGKIYTIPSNVHRANVLWAAIPVLEAAGLPTDNAYFASVDDFIAALEKIKTATPDIVPLSVGGTWCQVHLLETILIAELGAEGYNGLFDGSTDWNGANVTTALTKFAKLMSFTNIDRDSFDWEPPMQMLLDGKAAFNVMGDWVPALLDSNDLVAGTDYLYAPSPGTEGIYDFLADSFSRTVGAPHKAGAEAWLDVISSVEGQTAFNKVKGSIPARTDIDLSSFSEYQQSAADSFKSDAIVGSIQHGAAATIQQGNATNDAVSKFTTSSMDADALAALQAALAAAYAG